MWGDSRKEFSNQHFFVFLMWLFGGNMFISVHGWGSFWSTRYWTKYMQFWLQVLKRILGLSLSEERWIVQIVVSHSEPWNRNTLLRESQAEKWDGYHPTNVLIGFPLPQPCGHRLHAFRKWRKKNDDCVFHEVFSVKRNVIAHLKAVLLSWNTPRLTRQNLLLSFWQSSKKENWLMCQGA